MRTHVLFAGSAVMMGLLGCSNPRFESVPVAEPVLPVVTSRTLSAKDLPLDQTSRLQMHLEALAKSEQRSALKGEEFLGQPCQVGGTSCLEMDDRPFEICLLSSQDCSEKLRESLRRGESFGPLRPGPAR
jgi:hypothetical protein